MSVRLTRRDCLALGLLGIIECSLSGCGTIMHPERRGQPAGPIDWKIVTLNGIGLIFFFIPGVIAFAVDFTTGAIYLPPERYRSTRPEPSIEAPTVAPELTAVQTGHPEPTAEDIEHALAQHTGKSIRLVPGGYQTRPLNKLGEFWATCRELTIG